ncbi:hypothetical protein JCM6882_008185 [Rhodosporidiobolus microsporus]
MASNSKPVDTASDHSVEVDDPVVLQLVAGPHRHRHNIHTVLHSVLTTLALFLRIPVHLVWHYILTRWRSPLVQELGRSPLSQVEVLVVRQFFLQSYLATSRSIFRSGLPSKWLQKAEIPGTKGVWWAPPGTEGKRGEDDLVLLWIHGGGFFVDTAPACGLYFAQLTKELNEKRGVKFSILAVDYELAPEKIYPSQLIETLAAYHYLVNDLGISPSKICVGGDSAGGNLAIAFLLHLARPNPRITVPKSLGPTPGKPGSAYIVSPFVDLVSYRPSRSQPFNGDYIDDGGVFAGSLSYVGAVGPSAPPELKAWFASSSPSWNPLRWFAGGEAADHPPPDVVDFSLSIEEAEKEGKGVKLLSSPYVNPHPAVVKDLNWYREAFPSGGRTMVTWGGKEIFSDDVVDFVEALKKVDVAPVELCKPLGMHDWNIFDTFLPLASRDKNGGEQAKSDFALKAVADFFAEKAKEASA